MNNLYAGFITSSAADAARAAAMRIGCTPVAAYAPYDASELLDQFAPEPRLARYVLAAGVAGSLAAAASQAWVARITYPLNVGGRPLLDWIGFAPMALEVGLLSAIVAAVVGTVLEAGLPSLDDAIFAADPTRSLQDRIVLVFHTGSADDRDRLFELLRAHGAGPIVEVEP
jgi:hypothetical protein